MKEIPPDPFDQTTLLALLEKGFKAGHQFRFVVASQSMTPLLKPGDPVFIQDVDPKQLLPGDMVVLRREADLAIHRLIQIDGQGWFHTKGDNLPFSDPPILAGDILGKAIAIEQGQWVIHLYEGRWVRMNRILAALSRWEARWVQGNKKGASSVFPRKAGLEEANQPDWGTGNGEWGLGGSTGLKLFFRGLRWGVVWFFGWKVPGRDS